MDANRPSASPPATAEHVLDVVIDTVLLWLLRVLLLHRMWLNANDRLVFAMIFGCRLVRSSVGPTTTGLFETSDAAGFRSRQ